MPFFANATQIALPIPFSRLVPVTIAICLFIVVCEVLVLWQRTLQYAKILSYFLHCRSFLLKNIDVVLSVLLRNTKIKSKCRNLF